MPCSLAFSCCQRSDLDVDVRAVAVMHLHRRLERVRLLGAVVDELAELVVEALQAGGGVVVEVLHRSGCSLEQKESDRRGWWWWLG